MLKMSCPECQMYGTLTAECRVCRSCRYLVTKEEAAPALAHDARDKALTDQKDAGFDLLLKRLGWRKT